MKLTEIRDKRLKREGFRPWERRQLVNQKITSPEMVALRKERKSYVRESRKLGLSKKAIAQQIRAMYHTEGYFNTRLGRYEPLKMLADTQQKLERELRPRFAPPGWERSRAEAIEGLAGKPTALIDYEAVRELQDAGFLDFEISLWNESQTPVHLDRHPWDEVLRMRTAIVEYAKKQGWTRDKYEQFIRSVWTQFGLNTPYEFLRAVYKPHERKDYIDRRRDAAQAKQADYIAVAKKGGYEGF